MKIKFPEQKDMTEFKIIEKAKLVGFTELPIGGSLLENQVIELFKETNLIMSAKVVQDLLGEKTNKWYSDKLWNLEKKGILVVLSRGLYQIKKVRKD